MKWKENPEIMSRVEYGIESISLRPLPSTERMRHMRATDGLRRADQFPGDIHAPQTATGQDHKTNMSKHVPER